MVFSIILQQLNLPSDKMGTKFDVTNIGNENAGLKKITNLKWNWAENIANIQIIDKNIIEVKDDHPLDDQMTSGAYLHCLRQVQNMKMWNQTREAYILQWTNVYYLMMMMMMMKGSR